MAKRKVKSVLEFTPRKEEYSITNPENGDEFVIVLRPLTPREVADLSAKIVRPKPKEKGFQTMNGSVVKDDFGRPIPIYDEDAPDYKTALSKANQDFVYAWLVESMDVEIPGETFDEKMETLRTNIPNWVFLELQKKLQEIQGYRKSEVVYQKKRLEQTQSDTSNTNSAKNGESG